MEGKNRRHGAPFPVSVSIRADAPQRPPGRSPRERSATHANSGISAKAKRPLLTTLDRVFWVTLRNVWSDWRRALATSNQTPLCTGNASGSGDSLPDPPGAVPFIEGAGLLFTGQRADLTRKMPFEFMKAHSEELAAKRPTVAGRDWGMFFPYVGAEFCDLKSKAELKSESLIST